MRYRTGLAEALARAGAVKLGDFVLSSGIRSTYYIDLRHLTLDPVTYRKLAEEVARAATASGPDALAGPELGGALLAAYAAALAGLPFTAVRLRRKEHGTRSVVEGDVKGLRILLIDDVATTGSTLIKAVEALRRAGAEVGEALVAVDRCSGATEALERVGVRLRAVLTLEDFVKAGVLKGVSIGECAPRA